MCYESIVFSLRRRLPSTLGFAALGHTVLAVALLEVRPRPRATRVIDEPIAIALEDPGPAASPAARVTEGTLAAPRAVLAEGAIVGAASPSATARAGSREESRVAPLDPDIAATAGPGFVTFGPVQRAPLDLGLESARSHLFPGAPSRASESKSAIERSLHEALMARDRGLGLGRASVLVSAAREAATSRRAPDVGVATFEIDCDAAGIVRHVNVDDRAWADVAPALVHAMSGKTVRMRTGARGLRAHVRVVAERAPPSGNGGTTRVGAVPDDVPGAGRACEGTGWSRRCVAGMPLGVTSAEHDSANAGAKASRVVHVQLLDETET